jgi:hypothetical protein
MRIEGHIGAIEIRMRVRDDATRRLLTREICARRWQRGPQDYLTSIGARRHGICVDNDVSAATKESTINFPLSDMYFLA